MATAIPRDVARCLLCSAVIVLVIASAGASSPADGGSLAAGDDGPQRHSRQRRAILEGPENIAVLAGATVQLRCVSHAAPPAVRVMWGELIGGGGNIISDNENLLTHPNRERYSIIHSSATEFHLEVRDVRQSDGGPYICQDTLALTPAKIRGIADLIVLASTPICTNTAPDNGNVIEGQTFTIECVINYQGTYPPKMHWTGPGPFDALYPPPTPSSVWSGMQYTVNRSMDIQFFECLTNFTDLGDLGNDQASNVPTWEYLYRAPQLHVSWGPDNIRADPIKPTYEVGDVITCTADAKPEAQYLWQNMRTQTFYFVRTYVITEDMVGFTDQLRCQAQNIIQGGVYSRNLFINATVPAPTTPTIPTTTPSTTTPPPVSNCDNLSGRWRSDDPYAEAIFNVVAGSNMGRVEGLMMNRSDTYWVEVIGTTRVQDFAYLGLSAVWPYDSGVTSISGECHKCNGVEVLHVDGMWKSIHASESCGAVAPQTPYPSHALRRVSSVAAALGEPLRVWNPSKISKRLGVTLKK